MVYATIDTTQGMALAGHRIKAVEYLLGNHVIAETEFAPRLAGTAVRASAGFALSDADGNAVFSMDQPGGVRRLRHPRDHQGQRGFDARWQSCYASSELTPIRPSGHRNAEAWRRGRCLDVLLRDLRCKDRS